MDNRRDFLKKSALLGFAGLAHSLIGKNTIDGIENISGPVMPASPFSLPKLPYSYDALEPFIDKQTMEIHHTKHHQGYVDKINSAANEVDLNVDDAAKCRNVNEKTNPLVRNNMGGHYNHSLFWQLMAPNKDSKENKPTGALAEAIGKNFKSVDDFKKEFSEKAGKIFGSGWCWLIVDDKNKLSITTTANQDNPLMQLSGEQGRPVLALDVWEHAYYLKYQNKRPDYISSWWNVVNWKKADELLAGK
jgi:superoxide dismutase, Fe-Mn family